ncbi:MAG: hypothetical protein NHB15_13650 [Methanosarcina barkeri]|nr:hypothetical protein [Methanosarcina sp. ERenArc_MAG2]
MQIDEGVEEEEIEAIPAPKEPDKDIELKKEIAKEVMKKLNAATISINGARQIAKVIQEAPETTH